MFRKEILLVSTTWLKSLIRCVNTLPVNSVAIIWSFFHCWGFYRETKALDKQELKLQKKVQEILPATGTFSFPGFLTSSCFLVVVMMIIRKLKTSTVPLRPLTAFRALSLCLALRWDPLHAASQEALQQTIFQLRKLNEAQGAWATCSMLPAGRMENGIQFGSDIWMSMPNHHGFCFFS